MNITTTDTNRRLVTLEHYEVTALIEAAVRAGLLNGVTIANPTNDTIDATMTEGCGASIVVVHVSNLGNIGS